MPAKDASGLTGTTAVCCTLYPMTTRSCPSYAVGEEVPAKEAGDLTAAALATPGLITPVARLKLLQGRAAFVCMCECA